MKKATKGALAAAAAGSLLLGGAGSLAYWTSTGTVNGSSITSGKLSLSQDATQSGATDCTAWKISFDGLAPTAFTAATDKIVPGDTLTKTCDYTVNIVGKNLTAKVGLETPTFTSGATPSALASALAGTKAVMTLNTVSITASTSLTEADNLHTLHVVYTVPFLNTVSGTTAQNVPDTLNTLSLTLTQQPGV